MARRAEDQIRGLPARLVLGGALAGFPGALLATPLVGAVKLAYEQARGSG